MTTMILLSTLIAALIISTLSANAAPLDVSGDLNFVPIDNKSFFIKDNRRIDVFYDFTIRCVSSSPINEAVVPLPARPLDWYPDNGLSFESFDINGTNFLYTATEKRVSFVSAYVVPYIPICIPGIDWPIKTHIGYSSKK